MAHGLFKDQCARRGLGGRVLVDSAGTSVGARGRRPDARAQSALAAHGVDISRLKARAVEPRDFDKFDYILAMDRGHLEKLQELSGPEQRARIELVTAYARRHSEIEIPDPYFGNDAVFERVLTLLEDAVEGFANDLLDGELVSGGSL